MHDSASVTNMNSKCSVGSGEVLRNKQKMRPPPPPSLGSASLKHFQNGNLQSNSENLTSLKDLSFVSFLSNVRSAEGPVLVATETWGTGRKAPEVKNLKNACIEILI